MDLLVLVELDFVTGTKNLCFQLKNLFLWRVVKLGLERTKASLTLRQGAALLSLLPGGESALKSAS